MAAFQAARRAKSFVMDSARRLLPYCPRRVGACLQAIDNMKKYKHMRLGRVSGFCGKHRSVALLVAALSLLGSGPALAYVDPGTGSLLLQALIALVAGGLALFRGWRMRLMQIFQRGKDKASETRGIPKS